MEAKGSIRILALCFADLCPDFCWKNGIQFRYLIFYQEPEAHTQADGQDVTVIVHEDDSVYDCGGKLCRKKD